MTPRACPVLLLALLASCQSMKEGVFTVEGRAIVYDDTSADDFDAATSFDEEDVDVSAYGAQAALMTPLVDVLAGVDLREFEDEDAPELSLGARRRFLEVLRLHPYVEGNLRYGLDLDNGVEKEDYAGWNLGVGVLVDLTDALFVNVRLLYESTSIDLPGDDATVDGVIGTLGIGVSL